MQNLKRYAEVISTGVLLISTTIIVIHTILTLMRERYTLDIHNRE